MGAINARFCPQPQQSRCPPHLLPYGYVPISQGAQYGAITNVAPGATGVGQVVIESGSDFIWLSASMSGCVTGGGADLTPGLLATVQIVDTRNQRSVYFTAAQIRNAFGSAKYPAILMSPLIFPAGDLLQVYVTNIDSHEEGNNTDYFLLLMGVKDSSFGAMAA